MNSLFLFQFTPILTLGFWLYVEIANRNIYIRLIAGVLCIVLVSHYVYMSQQKVLYMQEVHFQIKLEELEKKRKSEDIK